ncbi:AraC family transcriptional regulator [uncultured Intestinimonas sp.]|uniref:AraC family transcriptional regulator n=1 Tax=uncultured Intestinimonas sp. TaxID=1689265 RepID=UPI00342304CB
MCSRSASASPPPNSAGSPLDPASGGARPLPRPRVLPSGKALAAGGIHFRRGCKIKGAPGNGPAVSGAGCGEPNYFSYVFKKRFGVTPSQFRKQPT